MPNSHLSFKGMNPIIKSIGHCIAAENIRLIQQSEYLGTSIDESTDCSGNSILLLYIRFYCSFDKKTKDIFVTLFQLKSLTAEAIYQKIKPWLVDYKIYNKILFYCSDAAANVSSLGNGVAGLIKRDLPKLLSHKCLCHLQNTALKHTYKQFQQFQSFNKNLLEVINYIDNSPRKQRIIEDKQIELEYENIPYFPENLYRYFIYFFSLLHIN